MSITLSVYYCFNNFWQRNIISCVIRSLADYMAEWENVPLDPETITAEWENVPLDPETIKKHQVD